MLRWMSTLFLLFMALAAPGAEGRLVRHGVTVTVRAVAETATGGVIEARFAPEVQADPLHLYGIDLPADAVGVATRIDLPPGSELHATGPLAADLPSLVKAMAGFEVRVYPPGPVVLRLPVAWPAGDGASRSLPVLVSYMACTESACLRPVQDQAVMVAVPTVGGVNLTIPRLPVPPAITTPAPRQDPAVVALAERVAALEQGRAGIPWRRPASVAELESIIREAHAAGRAALIDVTGPTCLNCQVMKKTVFPLAPVARAWASGVPISVDTDRHPELALWQRDRLGTEARPLYVHLAPGATPSAVAPQWSAMVDPADPSAVAALAAFLERGTAPAAADGDGWGAFLLLAVAGGLVTLLMPCTYPMIPFTLGFFAKQAAAGRRTLPLALAYGAGLVACFAGLGLVIQIVFKSTLSGFAGSPWTNLAIAVLFVLFGLSLLGAFLIRLPAGMLDRFGGARSGYIGALLMGLVFAATAFTCVAPFAGAVLSGAVVDGSWGRALGGMAVYGLVIAVPFVVLALVPGWAARLPRAGGWMNEVKVVGGIVELAAALKFLYQCDIAWGWDVFGRTLILVLWAASALLIGLYLLGVWRVQGDDPVAGAGPGRLLVGLPWIAAALWFTAGAGGGDLGWIEGLFPDRL